MTTNKTFSVAEAIELVGEGFYPSLPGKHVNKIAWGKFIEENIDNKFINQAIAKFQQISPDTLNGLEELCEFIANGDEPNRMIAGGIISCRIAPAVATGDIPDIGRLSFGACWDNGWKLILNPKGRDLSLTFGWGDNFSLELNKDVFNTADSLIEEWGNRIAGKPVASVA